jgi:serine/threonine protein kinase
MFDLIRQIELFDCEETRFYIGSLILCLESLHESLIVYRDLKPENIFLDDKGFIFLFDFESARKLPKTGARTTTVIGTPHYMAPEII